MTVKKLYKLYKLVNSVKAFTAAFFIAAVIIAVSGACAAGASIYNCWYENREGRLLLELTDKNSYHALFLDRHNELTTEEGLFRYSERSKKISFSPSFINNKYKSPIYGREFLIISQSEDSLEIRCLKEKTLVFSFIKDERHVKKGCHCKFCDKKK